GILLRRIDLAVQQEAAQTKPTAKGDAVREAVKGAGAALERAMVAASIGARYDAPSYAGHAGVSVWVPHLKAELSQRMASVASSRFYAALEDKSADGWKAWIEMVWKPPKLRK